MRFIAAAILGLLLAATAVPGAAQGPAPSASPTFDVREGDFAVRDFRFKDGQTLPSLTIHYRTLGHPVRNAAGKITNAVLLLHGTSSNGGAFLSARFGGALFGPGQPLDSARFYLIMPDSIGHGRSSKPSDGLRTRFPKYDYDDMVDAQHRLLTEKLGVERLELIVGTSMGCMHAFVWGEAWPDFAKRLLALACAPTQLAGRNRAVREMMIDAIRSDPGYQDGNYVDQPTVGLRVAAYLMPIMAGSPLALQKAYPTRDAANAWVASLGLGLGGGRDANDFIYQLDSSRTYDPEAGLEKIKARVLWINSADDFLNPPELGFDKSLGSRIPKLKFILLPVSDKTMGHVSHSVPSLWKDDLVELLASP